MNSASKPTLRPPAVPLITHTPYFSVWSAADQLTDSPTTHWTGSEQRLTGLIRVDGQSARFMGRDPRHLPSAKQISLDISCTRSIYQFEFNSVQLTVEFLSPLLPDDLDLLTRPVTYIRFDVESVDGIDHQVEIYFDASAGLAVNTFDQEVYGSRHRLTIGDAVAFRSADQPVLEKRGDNLRIDWGTLYLAPTDPTDVILAIQPGRASRTQFENEGYMDRADDMRFPRTVWDADPVLAAVLDLGKVGDQSKSSMLMLAYDEEFAAEYFQRRLVPYWKRNGTLISQILESAVAGYGAIRKRCQLFDETIYAELAHRGGAKYARVAELAFRQCLSAHCIVEDFDGTLLMFSKENFSNGCICTVDVTYPGSPSFLKFNVDLLQAQIEPILDYAATPRWRFPFAPHDLGTYPKANGQVYGGGEMSEEDQMPVEECGNMLILTAAVCKVKESHELADKHWNTLSKWAGYLMQSGLDPENQLCTDDFAGHLAHNANLSIKAIVALGAFGLLCRMRGDETRGLIVHQAAKRMAEQWKSMAQESDHYRLAFDREGTWSQKYNLVWERLLRLDLFPEEIIDTEVAFYLTQQNEFGLPLDNRANYTKGDWVIWTATLARSKSAFEAIAEPMFEFVNRTPSRVPFSDWHDTKTAKQIGFQGRSVVGGVFIPLLKPL